MSRFAIPSHDTTPKSDGRHLVTAYMGSFAGYSWGFPGGYVRSTFGEDGQSVGNVTTPVHAFVGVIDRGHEVLNGASYFRTQGHGFAGFNGVGLITDVLNQLSGPKLFDGMDRRAAEFAAANFSGC
jgi:hypothetical protein